VYPDHGYRRLLAPGNFRVGGDFVPSGRGRMTVEWETAGTHAPLGLPSWAWPTTGDKIEVVGQHIFDCGHEVHHEFRSELHPARFLATYRDAALTPGAITGGLGSHDHATMAH